MKTSIYEHIEEDEKVLWSGEAEKFDTFDKTHKKKFIFKTMFLFIAVVAMIAGYIKVSYINDGVLRWPILILVALIFVAPTVTFFLDAEKLKKKVKYIITDRRLIVVNDVARDMPFAAIKEAEMRTDEDGHTSLLCGDYARKLKANQIRNRAVIGVATRDEDTGICKQFVFYALPESQKIKQLLKSYIPLA